LRHVHFTTSNARTRRASSHREIAQTTATQVQAACAEIPVSEGHRKSCDQTVNMTSVKFSNVPYFVRMMLFKAVPNPAPAKNTPSNSPPAAIFHLIQAESARARSESIRIQTMKAASNDPAIQRFARVHSHPARLA